MELERFLSPNEWIESEYPEIVALASRFSGPREAYEFVRDEIHHSVDVGRTDLPGRASEVLEAGHGLCFAKSHLLAAILRAMGIPSGLTYQRLLLTDDPKDGYCLHGLNTVYMAEIDRWIRLDARGNRPGIDAQFSAERSQLAFQPRTHLGEADLDANLPEPPPTICGFYRASVDRSLVDFSLPDRLNLSL